MMSPRYSLMGAAVLALTVAAGMATQAPEARAQVAAKVESQTRPNFGVLLDPPTRNVRSRQHRRYDYGRHRPDWRPGWPGGPGYGPGGQEVVLVDCGGNPGTGAVEDAVRRVRPGGTLIIRARGGACVGWLNIDKPITIIGEGGFDPLEWTRNPSPTLQAPDGLPCMTVAQGVRVEIRDMVFASPRAGDAACLVGYGAEIVMNRVGFRHAGDEAALYVDGGLLDMRNVVVDAQTVAPAIVADGATLTGVQLTVLGAQSGIEATPGAGPTSTLRDVTLLGSEQPVNFGPRAIGLLVRAAREYGRLEVVNAKICGYVEGVVVEGASVSISNSRICKADKGAVLYNGELTLSDSRIRADVGVGVVSGRAVITNNSFSRVRHVILDEDRAHVEASGNRVWSRYDVCRPRFDARYRDRYAPVWERRDEVGWYCETSPYRRDWWDADEGSLGQPYYNDAYQLDGYDRFQQGRGWYDRDGRYIDVDRPVGDARWRGGGFWGR